MIFRRPKTESEAGFSGSLKDFGLPDLFQILGQQQKTGVLHLEQGRQVVEVLFDRGQIVGASSPVDSIEDSPLGDRLIRGKLLSREQWSRACHLHREERSSIEQALVKGGMVTPEDLSGVWRLITSETLYGLFKWTGGKFRFEAKSVPYDPKIVEPLKTEYVLFDLLRMVDESPMLAERIPHLGLVFQKTDPLATLEALGGTAFENQRSFQMEVIFDLIDGQRTVQEIMDQGFIGEFDTLKNLNVLLDAGLIEPTGIELGKRGAPKRELRPFLRTSGDIAGLAIMGGLALILLYQWAVVREGNFLLRKVEAKAWEELQRASDQVRAIRLENAREAFAIEEGRPPRSDSELSQKGLWP